MSSRRRDLPTDHISERLWRMISEVLLQKRVFAHRPFVGTLHALVVWGFLAFIGVSIRHLWIGIVGIAQAPSMPEWYMSFVAFWAILVSLGITGLAFRRFVMRPVPLGTISISSGVVALLIVVLMGTYLLEWSATFPNMQTALWWVHTCALLAFPPIIARSKHLHLVLAPVAIFFRSWNTSRMRPYPLDQDGIPTDLGLTEFKELSFKDLLDVNACVECGRCTEVCPANRSGSTLDPKQLILQMQHGMRARGTIIAGTPEHLDSGTAWVRESDLMDCTTCGACEDACPVGIEHVRKIVDLRHGMVNNERVTLERVKRQLKPLTIAPYGAWKFVGPRNKLIADEQFPIYTNGTNVLLWLGCGVSYNSPDIARSMKIILDSLNTNWNITWGVLEEEICCGETKQQLGLADIEIGPILVDTLEKLNVKTIIVCDPHCTGMLDLDHRAQSAHFSALNIEIVPHSTFIISILPLLALEPTQMTVAFHDPCKLARGLNVISQPRDVLKACGAHISEPNEHGLQSTCCGAGGGQSLIMDEHRPKEIRMNYQRFDQLIATKPDIIATACPHCPVMLKEAADVRRISVPIQDIATIVANHIITPKEKSL